LYGRLAACGRLIIGRARPTKNLGFSMKIVRILLITILLVTGFLYLTSRTDWGQRQILRPIAGAGRLWTGPDVARSAGLSTDELNNIDIYKLAHLATVNITSTVYRQTI